MRYLFNVLASHGFVYPAIGIAQTLQQRGHSIAFTSGIAFAETITNAGFEYIPIGTEHASFTVKDWGTGFGVLRQIQHVDRAISQFKPDVLVGSALTLSVPILAAWHKLPCATIGLGTYVWPHRNADPNPEFDSLPYIADLRYSESLELCNAVNKHFNLPPMLGDVDSTPSLLGDLYLLRSTELLQHDLARLPQQVHCVGACNWEPQDVSLDKDLAAFVTRNRPKIYVQHDNRWSKPFQQDGQWMSGIPDFWPHLVRRFADTDYDLIVATGDADIANEVWADNIVVRHHISHKAILPHVNAVIATGTSSIMLSALTHGLPLMLVVTGSEAYNVAELCEGAGVAVTTAAHHVNQSRFDETVARLLQSPMLATKARQLQADFAQFEEKNVAASLLEQLGHHKSPLLRSDAHVVA